MVRKAQDFKTPVHNNWCPGCVLPGSLIHTNPDVKPIEIINEGERVLGWDGRYHRVSEVFSHRHQGLMYRIRAKCLGETILTPEHPVLIAKRSHPKLHNKHFELIWERADQIEKGDYLAYPIPSEVISTADLKLSAKRSQDRRSAPLPESIPLTPEFLRLAGYYLAEGWIDHRSAKKDYLEASVCFAFHHDERAFVRDIEKIVEKLFDLTVSVYKKPKKNLTELAIHSSRLARAFKEWFGDGAANKKIPHELMLLPPTQQRELLKGLWRGDGWVHSTQARACYKTISKKLREHLKLLLLRQGIVPSVYTEPARPGHREAYTLFVTGRRDVERLTAILGLKRRRVRSEGKPPSTIVGQNFVMIPVAGIETFEYDGLVWNLEVEDVHSYVSESATLHNCGDFGILNAVQMALAELDLEPHRVAVFSGIGCSGKTPHYINTYGIHTLHGRVLPYAAGAKLANPDLTVLAVGGDGDGLGIGSGHFVNAGRRNVDITYILHNNGVYGLTKGQASPTLKLGVQTKSLPQPNINQGVNPLFLALAAGYTFIARSYAYDIKHLVSTIKQAIAHNGSAFIDVLQPCPTYNDINTREWYGGEDRKDPQTGRALPRVYKLEDEGYDPYIKEGMSPEEIEAKLNRFVEKTLQWGDRIPIGVLLKNETTPSYEERVEQRIPFYRQQPPAKRAISDEQGRPIVDLTKFFEELRVT
jgi:2-oxoglutarate ferredoxin oxidoreductase subunit beta